MASALHYYTITMDAGKATLTAFADETARNEWAQREEVRQREEWGAQASPVIVLNGLPGLRFATETGYVIFTEDGQPLPPELANKTPEEMKQAIYGWSVQEGDEKDIPGTDE